MRCWCWRGLLVLLAVPVLAADLWPTDLFTGQGELWRRRVALELTHRGDAAVEGAPVTIPVAEAKLVGARVGEIRVADAAGTEMLFDLWSAAGERLTDGTIPEGATLTVPMSAAPGATQRLYVYFDNPRAWPVPDFLNGREQPSNPGFELGTGNRPAGWTFDATDADHRLEWVTERPRSGDKCLRTTVTAGAEPSWIAARQLRRGVVAGQRYRLTAWVRGEGVVGYAGWYVHVAVPGNSQAVSVVEPAGEGTFDWRQVTIEFTAPADALSMDHGTVLRGTGQAWFDDVVIERLGADPYQVTVGEVETLAYTAVEPAAGPYRERGRAFDGRAELVVNNLGAAQPGCLIQVRATPLWTRLRRGYRRESLRVLDPVTGRPLPLLSSGDDLFFVADLPAASRVTFAAWYSRDKAVGAGPVLSYADLVHSPANRVRNASFEEAAGEAPADWPGTSEGRDQPTADLRRVRGGIDGDWCARTEVPPTAPESWVGWRQPVPVDPSTRYIVGAMLRTGALDGGSVRIHAHVRDDEGELVGPRYWATPGGLGPERDWSLVHGVVQGDARTRVIEVHLTTNGRGRIEYDAVLVRPVQVASIGSLRGGAEDREGVQVWVENPLVKVFQDTPAGPGRPRLDLAAGRGEQEAAQLCLRAGTDRAVTVTVEPLRHGAATLAPPRLERVGYVPCLQPSGYHGSTAQLWERRVVRGEGRTDGWRGWWPDYLEPVAGPVTLAAGQTQPLWLTWDIPAGVPAGEYQGAVTLESVGETQRVPVTLKVWNFTAPRRPTLQVIYDLRNGPGWQTLPDQAARERWWRFMAERKISTDHVLPAPEFALVDGRVTMDTTAFDRAATLAYDELQMSAGYFPGIFYAAGWAHPPRAFLGCAFPSAEYRDAYQQAVRLFWDHVKARGWADRLSLYLSDEPFYDRPEVVEALGEVARLTREVDPEIPVYSSTWGHVPAWDGVLNHWGLAQYGRFPMETWHERRAAGDKAWFTTDGQMEIDTPYNATERLLPYYCFAEGVDGYEFWGFNWYTYDPYQYGWHSFINQSSEPGKSFWTRYPNGDGYMAYPGEPRGQIEPLSTIRLEQAREGIEDYELLVALDRLAQEDPRQKRAIEAVLKPLRAMAFIPNAGGYRSTDILPDPDLLIQLRRRAGDLLDRLLTRPGGR